MYFYMLDKKADMQMGAILISLLIALAVAAVLLLFFHKPVLDALSNLLDMVNIGF
jgi:HAMP domain-containing protein